MEGELFEDVDEADKARFIGNFFSWVRNLFAKKKETKKVKQSRESLVEHQEKEEKE
jgi:hypothetical protein